MQEFDPRRLRAAMDRAELSVQQLARAAGLVRQSLSAILNSRRTPTVETVRRLAEALDVPTAELLADRPGDLRALRLAAGLTQHRAAAAAGLTRSTWAMLETGRIATLDDRYALRIAGALDVDVQAVAQAHRRSLDRRPPTAASPTE